MEKLIMNNYIEQNALPNKIINSFDIDGVIFMDKYDGVYPGDKDVIITGRSNEERSETEAMLKSKNITNELYLNPTPFESKSREDSGRHKGRTLFHLETLGYRFGIHYEDDPIQAEIIRKMMPHINEVLLQHDLVEKENVRHDFA